MSKLSEIEKRANDALDGMSVSKDRLAKDVLLLTAEVRRLLDQNKPERASAGAAFRDYVFGDRKPFDWDKEQGINGA